MLPVEERHVGKEIKEKRFQQKMPRTHRQLCALLTHQEIIAQRVVSVGVRCPSMSAQVVVLPIASIEPGIALFYHHLPVVPVVRKPRLQKYMKKMRGQ